MAPAIRWRRRANSTWALKDVSPAEVSVPALFIYGEKDIFSRITGGLDTAYGRIGSPKFKMIIKAGMHVWFHDGGVQSPNGKNPDCDFFEQQGMPSPPGCEERSPWISSERQREINRAALGAFFDAYLKNDSSALAQLRNLNEQFNELHVTHES
jgi:hypothetical protein